MLVFNDYTYTTRFLSQPKYEGFFCCNFTVKCLNKGTAGGISIQNTHCLVCNTGMWQHIWHYTWTPNNTLRPQRVSRKSGETRVGDNNNMQCKREVEPVEHDNAFIPPCPRMEYGIQLKAERIVFSRSRGCIWDCQDNYSSWFVGVCVLILNFCACSLNTLCDSGMKKHWKAKVSLQDPSLYTAHEVQQQVRVLLANTLTVKQHYKDLK